MKKISKYPINGKYGKYGGQLVPEVLMAAIDEGLSLLGESSKQAVYFHLEKTFKMNRVDIPYRIEEFADAIEKIFGTGAKILEIQIMKSLFKKLGHKFKYYPKQINLTFTEYIAAVKLEKNNSEIVMKRQSNPNRQHNMRTVTLESLQKSIKRDFQEVLKNTCNLKTGDF